MGDTERTIPFKRGKGPLDEREATRLRRRSAAARRFAIDFGVPVVLGLVGMVVARWMLLPLLPGEGLSGTIREKLCERGKIPVVCMFLLFWHLSYTLIRYCLRILPEFRVFGDDPIPAGANELADKDLETIAHRAVAIERERGGSILTKRILLAVARLGIKRDTAELGDLLRQRADADRYRTANAYAIPGFIVWAIPILGFVGTVLGIGLAVSGLKASLGNVDDLTALTAELSNVTDKLGLAFDTTLVALVMSIVALLVQTLTSQKEERMLADVEDYLTYRLQSRIKSETEESRMDDVMRTAIAKLIDIQENMDKRAGERASVTMQAMMNAQESIHNTITLMPQMLEESSASGASRIGEAMQNQLVLSERIVSNLERGAAQLSDRMGDDFREVAVTLGESMKDVAGSLAQVFQAGDKLAALQVVLQDSLDQLARVRGMSDTMAEVRDTLVKLRPLLEKFDRPIPLTFTVGGVAVNPLGQGPTSGGSVGV